MSGVIASHIEVDDEGVAWVADTRIKVIEIAVDKIAHGSSPEEIKFQYPHLTLAQIHAALAYYYDNQADLDAEIKRRWLAADELAARASDDELRQKLINLKGAAKTQLSARSYRRRTGSDTWHWCSNCNTWPASDYEEKADSLRPTTGELCNECQAKERSGNCRPWA